MIAYNHGCHYAMTLIIYRFWFNLNVWVDPLDHSRGALGLHSDHSLTTTDLYKYNNVRVWIILCRVS